MAGVTATTLGAPLSKANKPDRRQQDQGGCPRLSPLAVPLTGPLPHGLSVELTRIDWYKVVDPTSPTSPPP